MMQGILLQSHEYRAQPFAGEAVYAKQRSRRQRSFDLVNPATLTDEMRAELLAKVQARNGFRFGFIARMFGEQPNAHFLRPRPGKINELAKASAGIPFQLDHSLSIRNKVGEVVEGFIEANAKGVNELFQEVLLLDPAAQESFLLGLFNAFSIHTTFAAGSCSKCDTPALLAWFGARLACDCELGAFFKRGSNGKREQVEIFTDDNGLLETSFVTIGAFNDTEIMNSFQESNRSGCAFFGIAPFNPGAGAAFGDSLAARLESAIESMVSDDTTRADIIARMGDASGISSGTVNQILNGSINCPPIERLRGFARVLDGVSQDSLVSAAESDGCKYNTGANAAPQLPRSQPMTDPIANDPAPAPAPAPAPVVAAVPAPAPTPIAGVQAHAAPSVETPAQQIARLTSEAEARDTQLFTALFNGGVVAFKLEPADIDDERDMFNTIGGVRYAARLGRKRANAAHAALPTGAQAAPPVPAVDDTSDPTVADLSLVKSMAAQGHFKPETVTPENLAKVCGRLQFSL